MNQFPSEGGEQPVPGTQLTPEQLLALAALSGNINVEIEVAGKTYKLVVSVPTKTGDPYLLTLVELAGTTEQVLAKFELVDDKNFEIEVGIPTFEAGGAKIKGGVSIKLKE
jgi:hypothetical protein